MDQKTSPLLVTIPHSGEAIPPEASWLQQLPEEILLCDIDRFVDELYSPVLSKLSLPFVSCSWHRYAGDLNRSPLDVDRDSVQGAAGAFGSMKRGFHWRITTQGQVILKEPISIETHGALVKKIHDPFHSQVQKLAHVIKASHSCVYHLDLHSMPSLGTSEHRDPGELRADIVISDSLGKSSSSSFLDLVLSSYVKAGFKVGYNWPYYGGYITEKYGNPLENHHTLQVELNRSLYMDEKTKVKKKDFQKIQGQLSQAIELIYSKLKEGL